MHAVPLFILVCILYELHRIIDRYYTVSYCKTTNYFTNKTQNKSFNFYGELNIGLKI